VIKLLTPKGFNGEKKFTVDGIVPKINVIRGGDKRLFELIESIKLSDPTHIIPINKYASKSDIVMRDEKGGYMFDTMQYDPNFDPKQTTFGRGHRRVAAIRSGGKIIGYRFKPFKQYTEEWASEIFGYNSFDAARRSVYPLQNGELKQLEALYNLRPKNAVSFISSCKVRKNRKESSYNSDETDLPAEIPITSADSKVSSFFRKPLFPRFSPFSEAPIFSETSLFPKEKYCENLSIWEDCDI
jgi:hypothetical protein